MGRRRDLQASYRQGSLGMNIDLDLLQEFNRLVAEGNTSPKIEVEPYHDCKREIHIWMWYQGFHTERFYYCTKCDLKDTKSPPPFRF